MFPILNPSALLPPHTISLGHSSAPAPSILYHASNLDWRFVSYMIVYMFQCHSPKSSHPLPLPQSPKDSSIHVCLLTGTYYTEWGKPERKTPIQYTNAYMEFRKMATITLYARQQKRHRCIEQSFGLCGRGRGWDDLGEWH